MSSTTNVLIKTLTPTIRKIAEGGKVDGMIQAIKNEQAGKLNLLENETVEVMITTESDGREYVSMVILSDKTIEKIILSMPLSDMIVKLIEKM